MKNDLDQKSSSYILKKNKFNKLDIENFNILQKYSTLNDIIFDLITNEIYFYEELYEDVYKNFSPYKCLYPFKFEIFKKADENREISSKNADCIENAFFECESTLPDDSFFIEYNDIFSNFVSMRDILNDEHRIIDCWTALREPIKILWYTFAKGLRVKNKDEIYDTHHELWELEFKNCTKIFNLAIMGLEDLVYDNKDNYSI